jgi:hypothetical protein
MQLRTIRKTARALPRQEPAIAKGRGWAETGLSDFASLTLAGSGLSRSPRIPPRKRLPDYAARFDARTLWLDAVWTGAAVSLVCPRLNNLGAAVRGAEFRLDGRRVRARLACFYRHTVITLPAPDCPERVAVRLGAWQGETAVHRAAPERLAGRRVLMTLSKDNHPDWVHDWARFHRHHHGADACVLVDNGSAEHGPETLRAALHRAGLAEVLVLSTPLPFGPRGRKPFVNAELFLQTGVMNALRLRFLSRARSVLNCDIDELVMSAGGSIFARAEAARAGFVSFPGRWVYPPPDVAQAAPHGAHGHVDVPPKACPEKWCIVPSGAMAGRQWRAHGLEPLAFPGRFRARDAWFYHCRNVSTGWKSAGRVRARPDTEPDARLAEALRQAGLGADAG